jgi:hypothetical protein
VSEQQLGIVLIYLNCTRKVPHLLMSRYSGVVAEVTFSHPYADCGHIRFLEDVDNLPDNTMSKIIDRSRPVP